jgi:hypothetical protein
MVIKNSKTSKKDSKNLISQSITSSEVISSSSTSSMVTGGSPIVETAVIKTQQAPMIEEKLLQKSTSSSMVTKSSSSTKVSSSQSSSQDQKFFSTTSSSSKTAKSGRTQQLQSQSDDFLRGERTFTDIDAKRSKNGSILIESVDLHNVASDFVNSSNLDNLVSIEIESKDARAASSATNELVTNTFSSSIGAGNRNDVRRVESGRKSGDTTSTAMLSTNNSNVKESSSNIQGSSSTTFQEFSSSSVVKSEVESSATKSFASTKTIRNGKVVDKQSSSSSGSNVIDTSMSENRGVIESSPNIQGSSTATSSSTFQEFSSSSTAQAGDKIDSKATQSTASKNVASSKTIKNGKVVDNKNIADTTTTFTSKVFDDKTKSWVVVEQSSVNETDIILPATKITSSSIDGATTSNNMNTMTISSTASGIDSKNLTVDSMSSATNSKLIKSDVQMSSKSTKETLEKNMSSKKQSSRDEKLVSTSSKETVQVYDNKTKTWKNVDASSLERQKRPSYVRYRSQSDDGSWHTIYKRKLYDAFSKQWRIVDEKVVSHDDATISMDIPEMIENSTNTTTTTYTTKLYDTKTGKWTIVEEKSFVDTEPVNVTQDIKREMENDQADLANIITTTETTKVIKRTPKRNAIMQWPY